MPRTDEERRSCFHLNKSVSTKCMAAEKYARNMHTSSCSRCSKTRTAVLGGKCQNSIPYLKAQRILARTCTMKNFPEKQRTTTKTATSPMSNTECILHRTHSMRTLECTQWRTGKHATLQLRHDHSCRRPAILTREHCTQHPCHLDRDGEVLMSLPA